LGRSGFLPWRSPALAPAGDVPSRTLQEAPRLAMGFEQEPHFTQQLGISATFLFQERLPALGIDRPDGRDEQLPDSLGVGLHGSLRSRSSAYHATSARDLSGSGRD